MLAMAGMLHVGMQFSTFHARGKAVCMGLRCQHRLLAWLLVRLMFFFFLRMANLMEEMSSMALLAKGLMQKAAKKAGMPEACACRHSVRPLQLAGQAVLSKYQGRVKGAYIPICLGRERSALIMVKCCPEP